MSRVEYANKHFYLIYNRYNMHNLVMQVMLSTKGYTLIIKIRVINNGFSTLQQEEEKDTCWWPLPTREEAGQRPLQKQGRYFQVAQYVAPALDGD